MARPRYGVVVVLSTLALVAVAVVAFARLADRPPRPLSQIIGEASDSFAVHGVNDIAPDPSAYQRFAVEDSIGRTRIAADLSTLWPAIEALAGRPFDPLLEEASFGPR